MTIQIYHKERWVYIREEDGSRITTNEELAFEFTAKDGEKMKEYLESLGFKVITT